MLAMELGVPTFSPEQLVYRIRAGERSAEQELVNQYWRSLYYIINRRANDPELAADIAQETFIIVINKARDGQIQKPRALSAFIRQVGVNLLIANYRKDNHRKTDTSEEVHTHFPDNSIDIQNTLSSKKISDIVKQVMKELPTERDRDILYRYFVYGQSKAVICQEFGLSTAHFDRVLHRARNRLKQILESKLGIDLSKTSLSSLLSITLSILILSSPSDDTKLSASAMKKKVGDLSASMHLSPNAFMDRSSSEPENESRQHITRWT